MLDLDVCQQHNNNNNNNNNNTNLALKNLTEGSSMNQFNFFFSMNIQKYQHFLTVPT